MKTVVRVIIAFCGVTCGFSLALLLVPGYQELNSASAAVSALSAVGLIIVAHVTDGR